VLPFHDFAGLPLAPYRNISAWNARLEEIEAWRNPFASLDAPELPPIIP
jgi:glutathione S-transferase